MSKRRQTFQAGSLSYTEIGFSQAADLLTYPPAGAAVFEATITLGSGSDRLHTVLNQLMTWQAHKQAGYGVLLLADAQETRAAGQETVYAPDGSAYLTAGSQLRLRARALGQRDFVVVRVVQEQARGGFVLGTANSQDLNGELQYLVELDAQAGVQASVRGFLHSKKTGLRAGWQLKQVVKEFSAVLKHLSPIQQKPRLQLQLGSAVLKNKADHGK